MNTIFFKQIAQLEFTGVLQINIAKGAEGNLIVSILLQNESCGDNAKKLIPPLTLRGTIVIISLNLVQKSNMGIQLSRYSFARHETSSNVVRSFLC